MLMLRARAGSNIGRESYNAGVTGLSEHTGLLRVIRMRMKTMEMVKMIMMAKMVMMVFD